MSFFERLFGKQEKTAKTVAKDRLRMVLIQDRASIPAPLMEQMRREILAVVRRYAEIDERELDLSVEREGEAVALTANIPIRRVRSEIAA
ncbi:MAG: cell division topological specificity factor MinE [Akkermansiaceae bacterium]|nr:cell division topological specificity factor MinE [Armatimonadota bacterium]